MTEIQLPMMIAGGAVALIVWLWIKSRGGGGADQLVHTQFLFTKIGGVHLLKAEAVAGVMLTEHHGGQVEDSEAVVIHRHGRLFGPLRAGRDPGTMRRRQFAYVARQNDSSVLNLKALFDPKVPMFTKWSKEDVRPIRNLAARFAMAQAVNKPSGRDQLVSRLSLTGLVVAILGGAAWIAVTVGAILKA